MPAAYEIRADFDSQSIVIYQAYSEQIASAAIKNQTFEAPFSFTRMTWIKPSFLWLMERSNWAQKSGQEHILAIRISRAAWEKALQEGVLTSPEKRVYPDGQIWNELFEQAKVHIQWDPERNLRGQKLEYNSIQVGISRYLIEEFVGEWILEIKDYTPLARKIHTLCKAGKYEQAKRFLPSEKQYVLSDELKKQIGAS
ncbi:DUF4291 domain-containing protein [Cytophagaceae bacterium YF14B1]|uniref:DUF4291 domain-containing protein n=1 Tax=Xanthocytophaga flava TaxID=3048013 RepID=A0AAE3QRF2_9BACT|nr:DUF4291 domain-containing protein [Xanthocytophaga flavus]MDJ1481328.1 DUF4291 domain-containing protein [Xanthocytophaga flavus]